METSPLTQNKLFSYRRQLGLEARDIEEEDGFAMELAGLVLNNTFAFGGNIADNIRLWGGPQVLFGFYAGETEEETIHY
jgi:hypothetical protein